MSQRTNAPEVGPPDPEHRTSPIADEGAEELEYPSGDYDEAPYCCFNGRYFSDGAYVQTDRKLLRCEKGIWVPIDEGPY
ncbi:MAG: hypothetical protein ACQERE_04655 [Pseudomonadota bacterium]